MSFTCYACHRKLTNDNSAEWHWTKSYGPCEDCGVTTACVECKCEPRPRRKDSSDGSAT